MFWAHRHLKLFNLCMIFIKNINTQSRLTGIGLALGSHKLHGQTFFFSVNKTLTRNIMGYDDENTQGYESIRYIFVQEDRENRKKLSCGYVSHLM